MGLFKKFKEVLSKTRDGISKKLNDLFAKDKIGEDFYEELEDILISSDVSVQTTMEMTTATSGGMFHACTALKVMYAPIMMTSP